MENKEMKRCVKCGAEIVNGENGCMLIDECFTCHGGYPKYAPATGRNWNYGSWNDLDALEDRCVRDYDD